MASELQSDRRLPINKPCGLALVAVMALLLCGCPAPPKPPLAPPAVEVAPSLVRIDPSAYPNFGDDLDYESLEFAIGQSIAYLQKIPITREFEFGRDRSHGGGRR